MKKSYQALIIEDDADLSFIFAEALRTMGFQIEAIRDGAKALARLAEIEPDLIVLDMHLPHLSGMNVLRQIHAETRLLNTRVIVTTADTVLAEEISNKADLVLVKPIPFDQLIDFARRFFPNVRPAEPADPDITNTASSLGDGNAQPIEPPSAAYH